MLINVKLRVPEACDCTANNICKASCYANEHLSAKPVNKITVVIKVAVWCSNATTVKITIKQILLNTQMLTTSPTPSHTRVPLGTALTAGS